MPVNWWAGDHNPPNRQALCTTQASLSQRTGQFFWLWELLTAAIMAWRAHQLCMLKLSSSMQVLDDAEYDEEYAWSRDQDEAEENKDQCFLAVVQGRQNWHAWADSIEQLSAVHALSTMLEWALSSEHISAVSMCLPVQDGVECSHFRECNQGCTLESSAGIKACQIPRFWDHWQLKIDCF